jgi:peptide/nickel transport system substrate-binding protein
MKSKIIWVAISILMLLSLLLASCGGGTATTTAPATAAPTSAAPTSAAATTVAKTTPPQPTATTVEGLVHFRKDTAPNALTPKRGGTLTTAILGDYTAWDPTKAQAVRVGHMAFTSNEMMQGDWKKGPQGSGQSSFVWGFVGNINLEAGELAESWETPDPTTIIYHLVKGVKFQNRPPANGREFTAEDVVWNINKQFSDKALWQGMTYPPESGLGPTSVKALDKYTVEVKVPAKSQGIMLLEIGDNMYQNPPEVWTSGGEMTWKNAQGTGPFILSDYVSGSAITFTRNPDYFEKDPLHPAEQSPYVDTYKALIIPDLSTRITAIRTGKIDFLREIGPDDAKQLISANKDLQWSSRLGQSWVASGRLDKQNLPYKDINVRRALNLAVDKQAILKDYWKGNAIMVGYPFNPGLEWAKMYTPLEQLPADVQELYTGYNPTKAKQMLADAGYPNGFKAKIQFRSDYGDEVSMIKGYLDKVGVTLELTPLEIGVYNSVDAANSHDEMWYGQAKGIWAPHEMLMTKKGNYSNDALIDDPYYLGVQDAIAQNIISNPDAMFTKLKEAGVYELKSAWAIWMPVPFQYNIWWPWTQNYYGINWEGWANTWDYVKWIWVDQTLKKSMGY